MDVEESPIDLTETITEYAKKDGDRCFTSYVEKTLSGHKLLDDPNTKAWFVGKEKDWNYAFRVVWIPGNLHFSGDLDEVTFTHYHAMPTWKEAVNWVDRAGFSYLMEKSTAKRKFVQLKTVAELARRAEEYFIQFADPNPWEKIYEYLDGFLVMGRSFDATELRVEDPEARKFAIELLMEHAYSDFTPETVYNIMDCPDWSGVYEYDAQAYWQYHGMRRWAALVKETEEYKGETEEKCTKSSELF